MAASSPSGVTTDTHDEGLVVFLIGMRVNRWWRLDLWVPVLFAMGRMLRELFARREELGFLGLAPTGLANPVVLVQYWKSHGHLQDFANARDLPHLPGWREFNRRVRRTNAVGVWHETYVVARGAHETVYVNMPPFGLGAAVGVRPATGPLTTASGRISSRSETHASEV